MDVKLKNFEYIFADIVTNLKIPTYDNFASQTFDTRGGSGITKRSILDTAAALDPPL